MREILFRGKKIDNGEGVYGFLSKSRDVKGKLSYCIDYEEKEVMCSSIVFPETVGQYTGLTDKNGTKIFEGDICSFLNNHNIYLIVWNRHGWQCKKIGGDFSLTLGCSFPLWQWDNCKENGYRTLEVIGNIHDNPELLEGVGK